MPRFAYVTVVGFLFLAARAGAASAEPVTVGWTDLRHPAMTASPSNRPMAQFDAIERPEPGQVGRFGNGRREIPNAPAMRLRSDLDGADVTIHGFLVPIDFIASVTTRFMLVPAIPRCINQPVPPPDQLVLVEFGPGFDGPVWAPVAVTGSLAVGRTGFPTVGYAITAVTVSPW